MFGAAAVLLVGGAGAALALSGGGTGTARPVAPATTVPSSTPSTAAPPVLDKGPFTIATVKAASVKVYAQPATTASVVVTLKAKTDYGFATTMLVNPDEVTPPSGWLPVTVPLRKPNNTPGWVQTADVTTGQTSYAIRVSLAQHSLVLLKDGQQVLESKVIIGTPATQTPVGRFYVTDPLNCNSQSVAGYPVAQCDGAYGAFAIGVSGLSEALDSFSGTIPQIAIHGTNLPSTELGKDLSNGCIRVPNDVVIQLAKITPLLGTPVTIAA